MFLTDETAVILDQYCSISLSHVRDTPFNNLQHISYLLYFIKSAKSAQRWMSYLRYQLGTAAETASIEEIEMHIQAFQHSSSQVLEKETSIVVEDSFME